MPHKELKDTVGESTGGSDPSPNPSPARRGAFLLPLPLQGRGLGVRSNNF